MVAHHVLELISVYPIYISNFAGSLKQIDSGPSGIVYGVNSHDQIFCRTGITTSKPDGVGWKHVSGGLKYVSCGVWGCWGVNRHDLIFFRSGVTRIKCEGTKWTRISGYLKQVEVRFIHLFCSFLNNLNILLNRDIDLYVYKMPKPICYFLLEEIWLTGTNYVCCSQKILST